ncbi:hypothetical protein [Tsukamurella soli]|uniref:Antitoxin Xre/MbcA/ParS-like toxin-binding domain-containing protein n=1 Tax=Tsukamurella soli TaxID=644556 RepID=A0ABP8JRH9_9ACTN
MSVHDGIGDTVSQLSDEELIAAVTDQIRRRERFSLVKDNLTVLLTMAPTLFDMTDDRLRRAASSAEAAAARAAIIRDAETAVLAHPMLTSAGVGRVLGWSAKSRSSASRLVGSGKVVALPVNGRNLFPDFQFDADRREVLPLVAEINHALDARGDPWGVASWWLSETGHVRDRRSPAELAVDGAHDDLLRAMVADMVDGD